MKWLVRGALARLGLEVRRLPRAAAVRATAESDDAFARQRALVSGCVRPVIFDVGAHEGETALRYRSMFPGSVVHAFEPFPDSFRKVAATAAADPDIRPHQLALADQSGRLTFHGNAMPATNSLLPSTGTAAAFWGAGKLDERGTVEVAVSTVDDFCAAHKIDRIDLLKLDTQGTEQRILSGAGRMLREGRIGVAYTEILMVPTYEGQGTLRGVLDIMEGHGYVTHGFYNLHWSAHDGRLAQMDAIFTPG